MAATRQYVQVDRFEFHVNVIFRLNKTVSSRRTQDCLRRFAQVPLGTNEPVGQCSIQSERRQQRKNGLGLQIANIHSYALTLDFMILFLDAACCSLIMKWSRPFLRI